MRVCIRACVRVYVCARACVYLCACLRVRAAVCVFFVCVCVCVCVCACLRASGRRAVAHAADFHVGESYHIIYNFFINIIYTPNLLYNFHKYYIYAPNFTKYFPSRAGAVFVLGVVLKAPQSLRMQAMHGRQKCRFRLERRAIRGVFAAHGRRVWRVRAHAVRTHGVCVRALLRDVLSKLAKTRNRWSPVRTPPVRTPPAAPSWCGLRRCSRRVVAMKLRRTSALCCSDASRL